jgi:hypothetical protein
MKSVSFYAPLLSAMVRDWNHPLGGNLNEIHIPYDADEALTWAIGRESEMREERYRFARLGVVGALRRFREVLVGLDAVEAQA